MIVAMLTVCSDVNQEVMKVELGSKYKSVPPEELKSKDDFYEDLLRFCDCICY
jgi:hypothetical protein